MGAQLGSITVNGVKTPVPKFVAAESETKKATRNSAGDITLEGLWCYSFHSKLSGAAGQKRAREAYLQAVKDNGFKVGVKVKTGQSVQLSFVGSSGWIDLTPNPNITGDLTGAFGADPGEQWIGLAPAPNAVRKAVSQKGLHVCYKYKMTLTAVGQQPQIVPVVVTYAQVSFAVHYLMDVRIFTDSPKKSKTVVSAIK